MLIRMSSAFPTAVLLTALACAGPAPLPKETRMPEPAARPPSGPLVGALTRQEIEAALPQWRSAIATAEPAPAAAAALGSVAPGAEVTVYLGTWCGDSRREVSRLWRALDLLGTAPPFQLRYVGVDRQKQAPGLPGGLDLRYVPTLVIVREGREVGRIVESAPESIESDLGALLAGRKRGVVSGRE